MKTTTYTKVIRTELEEDGTFYDYDERGNVVYSRNTLKLEIWREFDDRNRLIHYRTSDGYESYREYYEDENGTTIHVTDSNGVDRYVTYDNYGRRIVELLKNIGYEYHYDTNGELTEVIQFKL